MSKIEKAAIEWAKARRKYQRQSWGTAGIGSRTALHNRAEKLQKLALELEMKKNK